MAGIFVNSIISWFLLKTLGRQSLNALGLKPNRVRVAHLCLGTLWPILFVAVFEFSVSLLVHNPYRINPDVHWKDLWHSIVYLLRSVAYEDLIFRGALLYILMQKIGPRNPCWFRLRLLESITGSRMGHLEIRLRCFLFS